MKDAEGTSIGVWRHMISAFESFICEKTAASSYEIDQVLQELWSGYGHILRLRLNGSAHKSVIVKHVRLSGRKQHPRGWTSEISHERKVRSYVVEREWYQSFAEICPDACRVPHCYGVSDQSDEVLLILEDLDEAGFDQRRQVVNWPQLQPCLDWLACFHACFMGNPGSGLWPKGSYWHLETRPYELEALKDERLKAGAAAIDHILDQSAYQTLVHGDAKLANFCFSAENGNVAAVDFQYVGRGCGMKDLAYFVSSCFDESGCERYEQEILAAYFQRLAHHLQKLRPDVDPLAVEADWRPLYPVAWTDFYRFLKGWSPGHWKIHSYSERLSLEVLSALGERG